ncbi:hypothetical protein [Streptomyces graminofaciens]|nr:hypothetical protein [Streptomyces graminofaciens]
MAGGWRDLDNPSPGLRHAVHTAFAAAGGRPEVRAWFSDDATVALVITG